jgi:hypothetical protein
MSTAVKPILSFAPKAAVLGALIAIVTQSADTGPTALRAAESIPAASGTSSDGVGHPHLRINGPKGKVTIDWAGRGKLEWASSPYGPWQAVGDVEGAFALEPSHAAAFFRVRRSDDDIHHAATWLLDLLPPIGDEPKAFDETLRDFLRIDVCAIEPDGSCSNVVTLSAADLRLQNNFYHLDWSAPTNLVGRDLRFRLFVAGLEVDSFESAAHGDSTLPIKFRVDDHPRLRTHVLHEQGFGAKEVAAVLVNEFALDAPRAIQVLFWDNYDAIAVAEALRDVFHYAAEATVQLLKSNGRSTEEATAVLKEVYGETASVAAQILQRAGYPCLEVAVAVSSVYQLPFSEVLPIMTAVGCAPAANCEYPPPPPNETRLATANLLWFVDTAFQPLPPLAGHRDNFDSSLLDFLVIDIFEVADGSRTLAARITGDTGRGPERLSLHPNFYKFVWKPGTTAAGTTFEFRYSVAGLDLGFIPVASENPGALPDQFRIDNHPVVRARVLHHQQQPAGDLATALRREFALRDDDMVRILFEENFSPTEIGEGLIDAYNATPVEAANALRRARLGATTTLRMLESAFGEANVTNNVTTLRLASFTVPEVWRALEIVRLLKDKDIEEILLAGGYAKDDVIAALAPRLLAKYACLIDKSGPTVYLHPAERYFPSSLDWFLERASLAATDGVTTNRHSVTADGLMDKVQELQTAGANQFWMELPEAHRGGNLQGAKAYVHAVRLKDLGMTDLQFWLFRAYNGPGTIKASMSIDPIGGVCSGDAVPGNVQPLGEHTGDWEGIFLRFDDATGEIVETYLSAHGAYPRTPAENLTFEGTHPVFYASLNGHASYTGIGDNAHAAFAVCESPFYFNVSLLNLTGRGSNFVTYRAYDFVGLDEALLDAPWMVFPGTWGPGLPFNLTDDRKEEIVRAAAGNCVDAVRVAIPIACSVVCAPFSALFGFGYLPCFAGCTIGAEVAVDPLLEEFAPMVVDEAFKDQTSGTPTTPGNKTTEWIYFRYPGEKQLATNNILAPNPNFIANTVTVAVHVASVLCEDIEEHKDCATPAPPQACTNVPSARVELEVDGTRLPLLNVTTNALGETIYLFSWDTTAFPDGSYTLRPSVFAGSGYRYQYPFGREVTLANNSVILTLAPSQPSIAEGGTFALNGTFTDPRTNQARIRIDWGDGQVETNEITAPASGQDWPFTAQHLYADDNPTGTRKDTYPIQVSVLSSSVLANARTQVTVSNEPPRIGFLVASPPLVATGAPITAMLTFADAPADTHNAVWEWGDGSAAGVLNAASPLSTSHVYTIPGVFSITNVLADDDRGSASATLGYLVAHNSQNPGGAGVGQIDAVLCDTNQPPNCVTQAAQFGFVLDERTGFFQTRFVLPGLNVYATNYLTVTNTADRIEAEGPCLVNGINNISVVLTNTFRDITEMYMTNGSMVVTNFMTNIVTRIETNTANFAFRILATDAPSNTFQLRLSARVGTNDVAQTLETAPNQPVRSGAIVITR